MKIKLSLVTFVILGYASSLMAAPNQEPIGLTLENILGIEALIKAKPSSVNLWTDYSHQRNTDKNIGYRSKEVRNSYHLGVDYQGQNR